MGTGPIERVGAPCSETSNEVITFLADWNNHLKHLSIRSGAAIFLT
jgi:hypothetical protein